MANNWVILDRGMNGRGLPMNLDAGMTIEYGGDFPNATADQQKTVFVYLPVQTNVNTGSSLLPIYKALKFSSANLAQAAYTRLINQMKSLGYIADGSDLRTQNASISGIAPANAPHDVATPITVSGNGFSNKGKITIGGVDCPITVSGAGITFNTPVSLGAAAYDVEYTDSDGNAAVLAGGLTLT